MLYKQNKKQNKKTEQKTNYIKFKKLKNPFFYDRI